MVSGPGVGCDLVRGSRQSSGGVEATTTKSFMASNATVMTGRRAVYERMGTIDRRRGRVRDNGRSERARPGGAYSGSCTVVEEDDGTVRDVTVQSLNKSDIKGGFTRSDCSRGGRDY